VLPGDVATAEEVNAAEIRFAVLPVTSTKDFATFMQTCQLKTNRPIFGVVSTLKCTPDAKSQFKVTLEPLRVVPDDLMLAILDRVNKAEEIIMYGYESFEEEAQAPAKPLK
jgi:alpha-mannosidase